MKLLLALSLTLGTSMAQSPPIPTVAAASAAFLPLFDGKSLHGWTNVNTTTTFTVKDGALRVEGRSGWLRSERQYADYDLRVEVRFLTDDADSGIFVRAVGDSIFLRGWPGNSYQVQARDVTKNQTSNPILIGNLYRHGNRGGETTFDNAAAIRAAKQTNEWQTLDIEVRGDRLSVSLNGVALTRATGLANASGYIGIQGEAGVVEYRSIQIREK